MNNTKQALKSNLSDIEMPLHPAPLASTLRNIEDIPDYAPESGEQFMSRQQKAHFIEKLQAHRLKITQDINKTLEELAEDQGLLPDESDRASQEELFAIRMRTRNRDRKMLEKINESLLRIKNDEFGWCEECGSEIGLQRLDARPTAEMCFDCKSFEEMREPRD
ncbi:MAG: RNA polymerase-binding protein DksA [Gammaproteobacteria bacterium]